MCRNLKILEFEEGKDHHPKMPNGHQTINKLRTSMVGVIT